MISLRRRRAGARKAADGQANLPDLGSAPGLLGVSPWLNIAGDEPLTLASYAGRVLLIEFWAFQCGNCVRTLPFLRRMNDRYAPDLQVIGVHTPELAAERDVQNVERAVRQRGLAFPVGLDNEYRAWGAYRNRYWPSQYLVDRAGRLRYTHVGEGAYNRTESAARALLAEEDEGDHPA